MLRLASALMVLVSVTTVEAVAGQAAPYKIVVLAGEDSVNVIQQKTAVAPLVEVRDRNDQPVPGAIVTFAVQGGRSAAFQGGASTLTIATNASGQAAATGLTPLTAGSVSISVEAAVQGQIVTAAISQVNVMTAAEAAAAAGAGTGAGGGTGSGAGAGAGGGAGSGGGISATTIGIIGGAAAAGAVAATQVGGGGGDEAPNVYRGAFSMNATLPFGNCARQENYSGTLELQLNTITGTITGHAEIMDATGRVTATTCPGPVTVGPIGNGRWGMPDGPVSGTESSIVFHSADVVPTIENDGTTIARTFDFTGSISGTTIPGEIHMVWRNSRPNFPLMDLRTSVTLTKQ